MQETTICQYSRRVGYIEILPTETMKICSHILYTKIYAEDKHIAIGPAKETENIVRMKTIAFKESDESTF